MSIKLPELPFEMDALEPHISAQTVSFHYTKHHQGYVTNTNNLVKEASLEDVSLEELISSCAKSDEKAALFNNAAQVWNHTFYWKCMKPLGGGIPNGEIAKKIDEDFGSFDAFVQEFKTAATSQFGSGWAWLVLDGEKLKVIKTPNADTPLAHGFKALLTIDVWEHAYYLDYQNKRADYVDAFLEHLVNWDFVNSNV